MGTTTPSTVPGYIAGTWDLDPLRTDVSFAVRHAMISKLRGRFTKLKGELVTGTDPFKSSVTASIDLASVAPVMRAATIASGLPASSTWRTTR
jgi:polyisoprenoid-binding protein YceI